MTLLLRCLATTPFLWLILLNIPKATRAAEEGPQAQIQAQVEFDRSEAGMVYFKVPPGIKALNSVKIDIYDAKLLGEIKTPGAAVPHFLLAGRPCQECIEDTKIFALRPTTGQKPM